MIDLGFNLRLVIYLLVFNFVFILEVVKEFNIFLLIIVVWEL